MMNGKSIHKDVRNSFKREVNQLINQSIS